MTYQVKWVIEDANSGAAINKIEEQFTLTVKDKCEPNALGFSS